MDKDCQTSVYGTGVILYEDDGITIKRILKECKSKLCTKLFEPKRTNQEYCSADCRRKLHAFEYLAGKMKVAEEGKAHLGLLEKSKKLRILFYVLARNPGKVYTAREIREATNIEAVNTACSEVRRNLRRADLPNKYKGWVLPASKYINGNYVYWIEKEAKNV